MRILRAQSRFCVIAALLFFVPPSVIRAQEAVSTTSSSQTTTGTSQPAPSSPGSATSSTTAPTAAVSSEPSGAGIFSKTPVKITATLFGGYDDNVNTVPGREEGSGFNTAHVALTYDFGNPRLQLSVGAAAGGT